ncbi:hypothetical protein B566_EDAN000818 [Ephemera danica]|nr:hypothetical protein B566_EDAN000818 [Ephemera danica]
MFHHIVESDRVGTQILKEMNKQKLPGEVTFMPLNRLHVKVQNYPDTADALPMVSKLNYENRYDKALRYIFGKTLICRNLEVATRLARTTQLDCVTLEGDQVSSKGSLTGGYFNTSRSRLEIQKTRSELMTQIKEAEQQLADLRISLQQTEGEINKIVSEMQKTETKNSKAKDVFDKVKADIRLMKEELTAIERSRGPKERSLVQLKSSLEAMQTTKEGLDAELHQELMSQLSVQDQREVDKLNDEIRRLTQENKEAFSNRMRLEAEKNKLENLLTNNLIRRKDELVQLENCKVELENIEKRRVDVNATLKETEKKVSELMKHQREAQQQQEKWRQKERDAQERMEEDARSLDKMATKQNLLQKKVAECTAKICDLGSLPSDYFDKYQNLSNKSLFKEMEKANQHLKKYSHVNKKALDQFMSFSEQREKLVKRNEELERGDEKIRELMDVLEQRKQEAIQLTFKQVSKNFGEVFQKLVPAGHAQLVMRTDTDIDADQASSSQGQPPDKFSGIGIRVSFTGKHAEMREMNQLSGGQKSLIDKDEVCVRRMIGAKKDQFFLNKKMVTRADVMNLLESAGFSRSNPYYIVKQGKINQMATAPDSQRLKLLREVAGTRVYDERREESQGILRETAGKVEKIKEFLRTIEERLKTLEDEKEELKEYQKWDRMRSGESQDKLRTQLQKALEGVKAASRDLKEVKQKVAAAKEEKETLQAEQQQLLKEKTKLELTKQDLADEETIAQKEADLERVKPKYEEMKRKEEECTRELSLKEQKRKELYAKQGRGSQFTSKEERDTWIQKELRSLQKALKDKREQIDRLTEELRKDSEKKISLEKRIEEQNNDMEKYRQHIDDHNKGFYDFKKRKDLLQSERNLF